MTFVVDLPGAFEAYFSGTGVVAGDLYSTDPEQERGAAELRAAWDERESIKRGKGHSDRLTLPSVEAVVVLAEYASTCISSNYGGDLDYSEVAAARKVIARCSAATGGRVGWTGMWVMLDGEIVR